MVTPQVQAQLCTANDRAGARPRPVKWGALAAFCGLLAVWAYSLVIGITLHGAIHLALVLAVRELIKSIQTLDAPRTRWAGTTGKESITAISEQPQESNS